MGSYAKTFVAGRVSADPKIFNLNTGKLKATFSIPVDASWRAPSGEKVIRSFWYNCVAWETRADTAQKHLKKGSQVLVAGEFRNNEYIGPDDQKISRPFLLVDTITFMDPKEITLTPTAREPTATEKTEYDQFNDWSADQHTAGSTDGDGE